MALFDPTSGAWFPDVSQATLGRERQSQATLQQIGQREDVNRQQKIQDDELKKQNKKIRSMTKVLIDSGDIEGVSAMQANTLDIGTLSGLIEGTGLALNRDIQRENIETSDANQRLAKFNLEQVTGAAGRADTLRGQIRTLQDTLRTPTEIPSALNPIISSIGETVDEIGRLDDRITEVEKVRQASGTTIADPTLERWKKDREQRGASLTALDERKKFLTQPNTPANEVGFGMRPMTASESGNPAFLSAVERILHMRRAGADGQKYTGSRGIALPSQTDALNRSIGAV